MKKVYAFTALILLMITFLSCEFGEGDGRDDGLPYYSFSAEERKLIISHDYEPNDVITYRNDLGEEIHFKVISAENGIEEYTSSWGSFWGSSTSVYRENHDIARIQMEILENSNEGEYSKLNYVFSKRTNEFRGGLNFPMWNAPDKRTISEAVTNIDLVEESNLHGRIAVEINGHLFERVYIISSETNESITDSSFGILPQNINEFYYDDQFGIVQFKDIEGVVWKVQYPN